MSNNWPDWMLYSDDMASSMHELARYANPAQVYAMGLGLGRTGLTTAAEPHAQAVELAEAVLERRPRYTVDPFDPAVSGQIIRSTQELLDGRGTCLDFAVTMAALCIHENIEVSLAVALPAEPDQAAHAFVIVHRDAISAQHYDWDYYQTWAGRLDGQDPVSPFLAIDLTPLNNLDDGGDLAARTAHLIETLSRERGTVYVCGVQATLRPSPQGQTSEYYEPPAVRRELGITSYLPDRPTHPDTYPSRAREAARLASAGPRIVLVGESGTGKSTMALTHAGKINERRGWFLDGSDRPTLRRSLAGAEAANRGSEIGYVDDETLDTLSYFARRRLRDSKRPWVLVVDNANEPEQIADLLIDPGGYGCVIVTTTDAEWAAQQEKKQWAVIRLDRLESTELREDEQVTGLLTGAELLPGIVRIAARATPGALAAVREDEPGIIRIVRAALDMTVQWPTVPQWSASALRTAALAAAFMPAEQISPRWIARAVFDGDHTAARAALRAMEEAGLVESSRNLEGARLDEAPLWMHRLVRDAVRDIATGVDRDTGIAVLARYAGGARYSTDELDGLSTFLGRAAAGEPSADFIQAATTVLDLLEGRGSAAVEQAAVLAETYVDDISAHLPLNTRVGLDSWATAQMAIARVANQGTPTAAQLADALRRCEATAGECAAVMAVLRKGEDYRAALLLRGRANAMAGILLRKEADKVRKAGDPGRAVVQLGEVLDILQASYEQRRAVFERTSDTGEITWQPDPDRHVDRAWYNIGGTTVVLANALHAIDAGQDGRARIAAVLTRGMTAYAGSLALRRRSAEITKYAAASLWGVALCAYTAALYCPGKLDLDEVEQVEELSVVRQDQTRVNLLRTAEDCATKALSMWVEIDGVARKDATKGRNLLRKVVLAWDVDGAGVPGRAEQLLRAISPTMADLGVEPEDLSGALGES